MLYIHTLAADSPIRKSYSLDKGKIAKSNYPFVYEFTSTEHQITSLTDLSKVIRTASKAGECLIKGVLNRQLAKESRRGSTSSDVQTSWICLDLDGIENYQSIDLFLEDIGCGDVDYILQWSSSMNIENQAGYRCHIFMLLDKPIHPQLLKYWLQNLNLTRSTLYKQTALTKTKNALLWPLDITTCQNDKLLYIAEPFLGTGITDPYPKGKRIQLCKRKRRHLKITDTIPSRDAVRVLMDKRLAELRKAENLPDRRKSKYKFFGNVECMVGVDTAVLTEMKVERGFVYFNLNGGDSWGYYHPEDDPTFIHNFKGEPSYRTEDLLPEYWAKLQAKAASHTPNSKGVIYFAFRDFKSSNYFNGWYDTTKDQLEYALAKSESQLRQFMKQNGQVLGDCVPDWNLTWDPHSKVVVDPVAKELNVYQPSPFFQGAMPTKGSFPTIERVYKHALGDDPATVDHFLNWLAVVMQTLDVTGTAWVLQGIEGTGKGVLFHKILKPLLGEQNTASKLMEELESEFTAFMENKFLVFIDEISVQESFFQSRVSSKLRNLITEPSISIRKMYSPVYMAKNYANLIFSSNSHQAVRVPRSDRRHNIGFFQRKKLLLTDKEVDHVIPSELGAFFHFLMTYPADIPKARAVHDSTARETIIEIGRSAVDVVCDAVRDGNLKYLWEQLPDQPSRLDPLARSRYDPYRDLIVDLVDNETPKLTREELQIILNWCLDKVPRSPNKFSSLLKHHSIELEQVWKHNRNVRGLHVNWVIDPAWKAQCMAEIKGGAI